MWPVDVRVLARFTGATLLASLLSLGVAHASKSRNAAVLARVLSFELTLDERVGPTIGVAVVYKVGDRTSEANAEEWFQALAALSTVKIKERPFYAVKVPYSSGALAAAIEKKGIDLILVCDGLGPESEEISRVARARHVLTAGNAAAAVDKDLTLCVTEQADKTKIIINISTAQLEGIRFSSNLLKLATIVR